jgi:hypothetical protein
MEPKPMDRVPIDGRGSHPGIGIAVVVLADALLYNVAVNFSGFDGWVRGGGGRFIGIGGGRHELIVFGSIRDN